MRTAVILSAHTMALGVVRALGEQGVPVVVVHYDPRDMAHVSRYVRDSILAPHPEKNAAAFIATLSEIAARYPESVLFPVSDESVVAVAKHHALLSHYYTVACPDWNVCQRFIEKKFTYSLAEQHGIAAPHTVIPQSEQDVVAYGEKVMFPCLVKPSQSHLFYERFKRKMLPAHDLDSLLTAYRQAAAAKLEVMLQEIIPGPDSNVVNYNAYIHQGIAVCEFTAQHIRNAPPVWGSPRVVLSANIQEVVPPGRKILRVMGFQGYACTEFKKDERDGIYKLMEVNGRHNLSTLLAVRCGINFPWLHYLHLTTGSPPTRKDYAQNIYWIDTVRDLGYSLRYGLQERYALRQYARPYVRPHVFAILSLHDPVPFAKRVAYLVNQAIKYLLARINPAAWRTHHPKLST